MPRLARGLIGVTLSIVAIGCSKDAIVSPTGSNAPNRVAGVPDGWFGGTASGVFQIGLDRTSVHGGGASAYISSSAGGQGAFASVAQDINAANYRGKRVRWSAWVKQQDIKATNSGLWMRIDGAGATLAFDNMLSRPLVGTADWHQVSVVLDVASNALGIALGALFDGTGTLLLDDMKLEIVGTDVPSTNVFASPVANGSDSVSAAAMYGRVPFIPVNLDFEGLPNPSSATVGWLNAHSATLSTTDPQASLDDLQPLLGMVGSAHLIGLGEDTHGTREFFRMKHRILELLVKQDGATYFAIEATSPEADDMNQYVLNGVGDPKRLLSRLYFWTWNTQEVLDMIQWMRSWNTTASPAQRVQFLGFDMQSPGAAMDSVASFIARVDASQSATVSADYACLNSYRNHAQVSVSYAGYAALPAATRAACAAGLQAVYSLIDTNRATYEAASSSSVYQSALHDARLVQQFELMAAALANGTGPSSFSRDKSMAENIGWIRDHAPAGARIVLWAHNGHINSVPTYMGGYLRANYGADYVNLGFAFGKGAFNAVGVGSTAFLQAWTASIIPPNTIEAIFAGTGKQLALFDTRTIPSGGADAAPIGGPTRMRSIGAVFDQTSETAYFGAALFPNDFDLLVYVNTTTPSTLLPFIY